MSRIAAPLLTALFALFGLFSQVATAQTPPDNPVPVPVLCYHRFGETVADSMTVTTAVFASHLKFLKDNGYTVIPLRQLLDYRLGKGPAPAPRSVVITVDDGHHSVYDTMLPLVQQYHIPITLFIYPSAISNASYAMTWEQLKTLQETGLFNIQSHTYWHPNFKQEKKRLTPAEYDKFVTIQLVRSKAVLEKRTGGPIDVVAWPFGIYDADLEARAAKAGYIAAFSIDGRATAARDGMLALPRFLMDDRQRGKTFENMVSVGAARAPKSE